MSRLLPALVLAVAVAGCASGPALPPTQPEQVQVFFPNSGTEPQEGYKVIGPVKVDMGLDADNAEVVEALKVAAAKLGATAIIVQRIGSATTGASDTRPESGKIGEALAIYWPAS